jgi:hypothetical protein
MLNLFLTDHDASPFFPTMGRSLLPLTLERNPRSCERQIPISSESIATRAGGSDSGCRSVDQADLRMRIEFRRREGER